MSTFEKIADVKSSVSGWAKAAGKFITSYAKTVAIIIFLVAFGAWSYGRGVATGSQEVARLAILVSKLEGDVDLVGITAKLHEDQAKRANRKLEELGQLKANADATLKTQQAENAALQKKVDDYVSKLGKSRDRKRGACDLTADDVRGLLSIR